MRRLDLWLWPGVLLLLALVFPAQARDLVWKVDGVQNSVYLAGSIHLMPPQAYPLPDAYERAYRQAEIVAFETDISALSDPAAQVQLMGSATYPPGITLESQLPERLRTRLKATAAEVGLPLVVVNGFRPWFAAVMLEMTAFMSSGYRADLGLDKHFADRAQADGKTILPLEALDAHIALLTGMSKTEQETFLAATLDEMAELDDAPDKLFQMWQSGDAAGLEAIMLKSKRKHPGFHNRLIRDRNVEWVRKIDRLLRQDQDAMVIVGSIHLVGSDGLPELLKARGYKPEQQ